MPVNWTESVNSVYYEFNNLGDYARSDLRGYLGDIAYLLESGVKVAMAYGDRDFACNWLGGENVSLNIDYTNASQFRSAGYTPLQVNSSYIGGQTRQYGNFSFTRVYESGHEIPACKCPLSMNDSVAYCSKINRRQSIGYSPAP